MIIGLARPTATVPIPQNTGTIISHGVSGSMLAEDWPDRMEATKSAVHRLHQEAAQGRESASWRSPTFASLVAPPSTDRKQALDAVSPAAAAWHQHRRRPADALDSINEAFDIGRSTSSHTRASLHRTSYGGPPTPV